MFRAWGNKGLGFSRLRFGEIVVYQASTEKCLGLVFFCFKRLFSNLRVPVENPKGEGRSSV